MKQTRNNQAIHSWQKKKKNKGSKAVYNRGSRADRKKISKRAVLAAFAVLLALAAVYQLMFSDYLRVKAITVSGNDNLSADELKGAVVDAMASPVCGFLPGNNFFLVKKAGIKDSLLGRFTEMDSVDISLKFPNELALNVKEKKPALLWCRSACYFVNEDGTAFMQANEAELVQQQKHFIKIIEEAQIAEETVAQRQAMEAEAGIKTEMGLEATEDKENKDGVIDIEPSEASAVLPAVISGDRVADAAFIRFALEIGSLVSHNDKAKVIYFKTKGYKTRELIGFTDKNTRLYFDATASAEKQAKNLDYLLNENIDPERIDTLQYVYLKNEDRVFYK